MASNISIFIENGIVQVNCQLPVVSSAEEIAAFIEELKIHLLGNEHNVNVRTIHYAPKELNEKDAAQYIGRSVSYLRSFRLGKKVRGRREDGPKYTRDTEHCVRYPVKELDKWLESRRLYSSCCEELDMSTPAKR